MILSRFDSSRLKFKYVVGIGILSQMVLLPKRYQVFNIIESWIVQMGYPLITVEKTGSNEITVSQEIFLIDPDDSPAPFENIEAYRYK